MRLHLGGNSHIEDGCLFKQKEEVDICVILIETLYIYVLISYTFLKAISYGVVVLPIQNTQQKRIRVSHRIISLSTCVRVK